MSTVPTEDTRRDDCPEWCIEDHSADDERDDIVLHRGANHVDGILIGLLPEEHRHRLDVRVTSTTNLLPDEEGEEPTLYVQVEAQLTTWQQAAELARTILDGFGYLKGA